MTTRPSEATDSLLALLQARVAGWFPHEAADALVLTPLSSTMRARSRLDRFSLVGAGGSRVIVVKRYFETEPEPDRPRLAPVVPAADRARLEHRALKAVAGRLSDDHPDLTCVPVLDLIDDRLLVMFHVPWPSVAHVVLRSRTVGRRDRDAIPPLFAHAGRWLRHFRTLDLATAGARLAGPPEIEAAIERFGAWLAVVPGGPRQVDVSRTARAASAIVPAPLDLAPGHGDFAMRNLLVDAAGRVGAIDTRARWRVPIEEDVATLLVSVELNRLQALSGGFAVTAPERGGWRHALLEGAELDGPAARSRVDLFELLVLWDRWAASIARRRAGGGSGFRWVADAVLDRLFRRHSARLMAALLG